MPGSKVLHPSIAGNQRSVSQSVISLSTATSSEKKPVNQSRLGELQLGVPKTSSIPYRLPKLRHSKSSLASCRSQVQVHDGKNRIWSRLGYPIDDKSQDVDPLVWKIYVPPKSFVQQMRQSNMAVPQFKDAVIAPSLKSHDLDDLLYYKKLLQEKSTHNIQPGCPTTPISRSSSPTKSAKSLRWTLGAENHPSFDKKGRARAQGPYSREFTVTCMPPSNWLKMRLGRQPPKPVYSF